MDLDFCPKQRNGVLCQQASGTTVLLDPSSGEYYSLEEVGARIWELCDGANNVGAIIALLAQEYDAPAVTIRNDVQQFLAELIDADLVTVS